MDFENILYKEESFRIIGACMKVHTALGAGFLESVYHEALEKEFENQEIEFDSKRKLQVYYNNVPLKKYFIADFICFNKIIIEIKAASFLHKDTEAQTINYLKSTNYKLGLLLNFGQSSLTWKRFINTK
ncbi:GxxExxY protein [Mesohalobacter halotolerans]|uniref:GxxExxY protein n=1 Tax=Mesohalobacter halotolerans TaxID=1883405 RepID=A0A4U5TSJ4_9FLAO|nr:GxxExxY protein [Mesohalobacter halotolerans]TKS56992.1 GxxExxY protein [Mesohalobacter halotolerans]